MIDISLLTLMAVTAFAVMRLRGLLAVIMLSGIYSLISAALLTTLDAVDVAMTEAAVGAGITTVLLLGTLTLTGAHEARPSRPHRRLLPLAVVLVTGGFLIYGTLDMPRFGAADAPIHQHVAPRYIHKTGTEVGTPNIVTAVLASYRGYDTMGETSVVFTAALGVLLLLGVERPRRRRRDDAKDAKRS